MLATLLCRVALGACRAEINTGEETTTAPPVTLPEDIRMKLPGRMREGPSNVDYCRCTLEYLETRLDAADILARERDGTPGDHPEVRAAIEACDHL